MQKYAIENFRLIAYGKFSKIVTSNWLKKLYIQVYNQGLILEEAKVAAISGLPFESFALFW